MTNLHRIRREAGFRAADDVAKLLGVPAKVYLKWETGEEPIPVSAVWQVAEVLKCQVSDFTDTVVLPRCNELAERISFLSEQSKQLMAEYLDFLEWRELQEQNGVM